MIRNRCFKIPWIVVNSFAAYTFDVVSLTALVLAFKNFGNMQEIENKLFLRANGRLTNRPALGRTVLLWDGLSCPEKCPAQCPALEKLSFYVLHFHSETQKTVFNLLHVVKKFKKKFRPSGPILMYFVILQIPCGKREFRFKCGQIKKQRTEIVAKQLVKWRKNWIHCR